MADTRRLYLLRHAQAGPAAPGRADYDRPLDSTGRAQVLALGRHLAGIAFRPALVVSSGAARTRGTLKGLGDLLAGCETRFDDTLYDEGEDRYRAVAMAPSDGDLLVVGHNPMIGNAARTLASAGSPAALDALATGFPTCALACFRLDGAPEEARAFLEDLFVPRCRTS